jgi:hypothetical protein
LARLSAEATFLPDPFLQAKVDPPRVLGGLPEIFRSGLEDLLEHELETFPDLPRNPVDDPFACPDILRQAGIPEDTQLMGNPGLLHLEDKQKLADTEVSLQQETENPQARPVGQGLEGFYSKFHFILTYEHIIIFLDEAAVKAF